MTARHTSYVSMSRNAIGENKKLDLLTLARRTAANSGRAFKTPEYSNDRNKTSDLSRFNGDAQLFCCASFSLSTFFVLFFIAVRQRQR